MDRKDADSAILLTPRGSTTAACAILQQVNVCNKQRNGYQHGDTAVESEPLIHGAQVGFKVERAQTLVVAFHDRLKDFQMRGPEPITILIRRLGKSVGRHVLRVIR